MAHTYILIDFENEEKAQQARHKLETWKQAFRLDKKLQYKLDRGDAVASDDVAASAAEAESAANPAKGVKSAKADKSTKSGAKSAPKSGGQGSDSASPSGPVKLLVRLYFSGHEKKFEQQWMERIPADELFRGGSPKIVQEGQTGFDEALAHFDRLD